MRRREFITLLGGAAAWPADRRNGPCRSSASLAAGRPRTPHATARRSVKASTTPAYVEGQNVMVEYYWLEANTIAADLDRRRVAVIATPETPSAALAAMAATTTMRPLSFSNHRRSGIHDAPII